MDRLTFPPLDKDDPEPYGIGGIAALCDTDGWLQFGLSKMRPGMAEMAPILDDKQVFSTLATMLLNYAAENGVSAELFKGRLDTMLSTYTNALRVWGE